MMNTGMTFWDWLDKNFSMEPLVFYIVLGLFAFLLLAIILILIFQNREITFGKVIIGNKATKKTKEKSKEIVETNANEETSLDQKISSEKTSKPEKIEEIRSMFPDQSITLIAIRSYIHKKLLSIAIMLNGGWAGMGYPGRILELEFDTMRLVGFLPELIDAQNPQDLPQAIEKYLQDIERAMYGIKIPDDEFQIFPSHLTV